MDSSEYVLSFDSIQTIIESADSTLSEPFKLPEVPELFVQLLDPLKEEGPEGKEVLKRLQDQAPILQDTADHQLVVLNQPDRNVKFR